MSHLALLKDETQAIKNPPPTFQTVSRRRILRSSPRKVQTSLIWGMRLVTMLARVGAWVDPAGLINLPFREMRRRRRWPRPIPGGRWRQLRGR